MKTRTGVAILIVTGMLGAIVPPAVGSPDTVRVSKTRKVGDVVWPLGGGQARLDVHALALDEGIPERRLLRLDLHGAGSDTHTMLLSAAQARAVREAIVRLTDGVPGGDTTAAERLESTAGIDDLRLERQSGRASVLVRLPGQERAVTMPVGAAQRVARLLEQAIDELR